MKLDDVDLFDDVFVHVPGDGTQTVYAAGALNKYIDAHPDQFEIFTTAVLEEQARKFVDNNEVEHDRMIRLMQQRQYLMKPIVFVETPDKQHILIDGRHRFVAFYRLNAPKIEVRIVPWDVARQFIIEDYPVLPESSVYDYSYINEVRDLRQKLGNTASFYEAMVALAAKAEEREKK